MLWGLAHLGLCPPLGLHLVKAFRILLSIMKPYVAVVLLVLGGIVSAGPLFAGAPRVVQTHWIAHGLPSRAHAVITMIERPDMIVAPTTDSEYPWVAIERIDADFIHIEGPFYVDLYEGPCIPNGIAVISLGDGRVAVVRR